MCEHLFRHRITARHTAWVEFEILAPEVVIRGSLKWDGCINWETDPDCMMHNCGMDSIRELTACFERLYAEAATDYPDVLRT